MAYEQKESLEQQALFQWAELQSIRFPELKLLHHIPNGGKRDISTAVRLKKEGVKAGVPDISLPAPRGKYHGLYIELKVDKNKPTEEQERWLKELNRQGYVAMACWGWEEAKEVILEYLKLGRRGL